MKLLILAAGFGTRLYPLTRDIPKSLLKIGKRHVIDYIWEKIEKVKDIQEVIIITNHKFYRDFLNWAKRKNKGKPHLCVQEGSKKLRILNDKVSHPKERLGAIGDMQFAIEKAKVDEDLLVIGGDTFLNEDLDRFLRFSKDKTPHISVGLYSLHKEDDFRKYAVVKIDRDSKVTYYREKPKFSPCAQGQDKLIGICLYYFPKEKLGLIKRYLSIENKKTDAPGNLISWLHKKTPIYGFRFKGLWLDVGDADTYKKCLMVLRQRRH